MSGVVVYTWRKNAHEQVLATLLRVQDLPRLREAVDALIAARSAAA